MCESVVTLEREMIRTEPVSPAETKPEPHPSIFAARDSKSSDCQGVGRNVAVTEQCVCVCVSLHGQRHADVPGVFLLQRDD